MPFGEVSNLWATHGLGPPLICLAGHVDVVPPGEGWTSPPFEPSIREGHLYGRGAADMKGSMAAMASSLVEFVTQHPNHPGTVAFLSTSDEEMSGVGGTQAVLDQLVSEGVRIDAALVGEPTSEQEFGDVIKVGRRGSLNARLTIQGKQGHTAYPHLSVNAIHLAAPFIVELSETIWDDGDGVFLPTTFQVSNLHAGTGAPNVVPGRATVDFNFRFGPASPQESLIERTEAMASRHFDDATFNWMPSAQPFRTATPWLVEALSAAIEAETGGKPASGTGGGTSDARCFAAHGIPVVEFGPNNRTIHAVNEHVPVAELEGCARIAFRFLETLAASTMMQNNQG